MKLRKPTWFDPIDLIVGFFAVLFLGVLVMGLMLPPHVNICSWKPYSVATK